MVNSQSLTERQKMSRLLQFVDGRAKKALAGFEGIAGGLYKALKVLEIRFGQPRHVTKARVDALVDGPNIANNDSQGLCDFADRDRLMYETMVLMNALSEINMTKLSRMARRLPVRLQVKWRDRAQHIRENGNLSCAKDLVEFIKKNGGCN
jgi:hypothetical protein